MTGNDLARRIMALPSEDRELEAVCYGEGEKLTPIDMVGVQLMPGHDFAKRPVDVAKRVKVLVVE